MQRVEISQIVKAEWLTGSSKYVHDSYIHFTGFQVERKNNEFIIQFYHGNNLLVTMKCESSSTDDSINFHLSEGQMKMELI
jgi:uncharacterized protein (DUF952 family)